MLDRFRVCSKVCAGMNKISFLCACWHVHKCHWAHTKDLILQAEILSYRQKSYPTSRAHKKKERGKKEGNQTKGPLSLLFISAHEASYVFLCVNNSKCIPIQPKTITRWLISKLRRVIGLQGKTSIMQWEVKSAQSRCPLLKKTTQWTCYIRMLIIMIIDNRKGLPTVC